MASEYGGMYTPCSIYKGPVKAIDPISGMFGSADHCASCGSTKVNVKKPRSSCSTYLMCSRCGRVTRLDVDDAPSWARFDIIVNGTVKKKRVSRAEMDEALTGVLSEMDDNYSAHEAMAFYGPEYRKLSQKHKLESTFIWIDKAMALDGYVDGLEVGEEYNFPDIPVSIVRVNDALKAPGTARPKAKPKTSKNIRSKAKAPAKKTSKPKTKASARSTSGRR